ncbi:glycosyl transferase [Myxozyma melibiosi]|uniref:Alpha-1,4 glucan phosphorylase n=1 Tax=Myxozyma melibiosi TaxID=54550 RepID=A0ABR1F7B7_9ASCO
MSSITPNVPSAADLPRPKHRRTPTGFSPKEIKSFEASIPAASRDLWQQFGVTEFQDKEAFQKEFIRHVETTLARSMYNCDDLAAYLAASQAIRDRLIVAWNKTQQKHTTKDQKRVYYLSLEFLMGRAMDNAMLNAGVKDITKTGVDDLGFKIEDLLEQEPDAALGNGGLGRLAACFVDSIASTNYPGWGYGLRYQYGIFKQRIVDGYQVESPDYWLAFSNPWEIPRYEIAIDVMFYGYTRKYTNDQGKTVSIWEGGEQVQAIAYDVPVPGYDTETTNNLRLWASKPTREFDFEKFNSGDYESSVRESQKAETISAVLYPNDNFYSGKELRLKQQYFWVAASLNDIVRRFKKTHRPWSDFSDQIAIQLNDTHPTIAIVELQRILVDMEGLEWDAAWEIVTSTFGYTNHTVLPEALEKWPVPLFGNLLPRHLEIIYNINLFFLQKVEKMFPKDRDMLARVSIIEESSPQQVRMAYLAIIGSHKVNGVAELHSDLIKTTIFKDFVAIYGTDKFMNVTNGITPRRWLHQANPKLSELIASKVGSYSFLKDLTLLKKVEPFAKDPEFIEKWADIKKFNKARLAALIKKNNGIDVSVDALFDVQVKRIHEYKRQQMNIFSVIHRYLTIKAMSAEEKKDVTPRVCIFGGKSAPGYYMAKTIIKLINSVSEVVNKDADIGDLLKVVFIADYNVSKAEIICPASDISQHISTAGTEASGTSNMKFVLNGGLILGTVDGANIEITREIGEENIFLFGHLAESVDDLRHQRRFNDVPINPDLQKVIDAIEGGMFGDKDIYGSLIYSVTGNRDYYLVSDDFQSYLDAQKLVDKDFKDKTTWVSRCITAVANMGFFSSDRAINEYAESIWNIEPVAK